MLTEVIITVDLLEVSEVTGRPPMAMVTNATGEVVLGNLGQAPARFQNNLLDPGIRCRSTARSS
jgi:hypothetical protein